MTTSAPERPTRRAARPQAVAPNVSPLVWKWFSWYACRYLARQFHAVRLLEGTRPQIPADCPLIVYMNHPGWHDPLVGIALAKLLLPTRTNYAPIDAASLAKYRLLSRVGFFGIDLESRAGAAEFLRTSYAINAIPQTTIWITPQGQFTDARERPVRFRAGLGHLAARLPKVALLPLAVEYVYWNESRAEVLTAFGEPSCIDQTESRTQHDADGWTALLERELTGVQDRLAVAAQRRREQDFTTLIHGRAGIGGVYDHYRRTVAWLRGRKFSVEHDSP